MKNKTKIYYDFEFIEGTQDKTFLGIPYGKTKFMLEPISVGMVKETGETYYAIFNDFNLREAWDRYDLKETGKLDLPGINRSKEKVYWIRENVLCPIYREHVSGDMRNHFDFSYSTMKWIFKTYGKSKEQISNEIVEFLAPSSVGYFSDGLGGLSKNKLEDNPVELYGYYSSYDHVCIAQCFGKMINLPKGIPFYTKDIQQIIDDYNINKQTLKENIPQINIHNALNDAVWNKNAHNWIINEITNKNRR